MRWILSGLALLLMSSGCATIPEDELRRLAAIESDWTREVDLDEGATHELLALQEAAIRRNPGLTALFLRYKAALQDVIVDGSLEDPRVQVGYFVESVETRVGPQDWRLGVSQKLPFYGKRGLRSEVALHRAHELREALIEERLRLATAVAREYWNVRFLDRAASITQSQISVLEQLAGSIESRFLSGVAPKADLISIQMEIDRQETELANIAHRRNRALAALNSQLDRVPRAALRIAVDSPPPKLPPLVDDELILRAREFGSVRVQSHRVLRQESAVAFAKLGYYPDFALGFDYIITSRLRGKGHVNNNGQDALILGVGLNLPIWRDRIAAEVQRAEDLLEAERAGRRDLVRDAEAAVVREIERAREAQQNIVLYRDRLLPQAEERLELSEQDYIVDRVDLERLIVAERELLDLQLEEARSLSDREVSLAELDYLTAGGLGRLPTARPAGAEDIPEVDQMNPSFGAQP